MKYKVYQLFPTAIMDYECGPIITPDQMQIIKEIKVRKNIGNDTGINSYLLDLPIFKQVKSVFESAVNLYLREILQAKPELQAYITQSWLNFTSKNQHHHLHYHTNSFLSGVFYVDVNQAADKIYFHTPLRNQYILNIAPTQWTAFNSESWSFSVKPNQLLIFPSSLNHEVKNKNEENVRISVSFNTFLKGCLGNTDDLNELNL